MDDHAIETMLWRALEAPSGIEIESSDVEVLKRRLYTVRSKVRAKGNQAFDCLQFITPPLPQDQATKIWLVKVINGEAGNGND